MSNFRLMATAAFGLEAVTARELSLLGVEDIRTFNGYVEFDGDESMIAKANLWLRTADRVFIKLGQFPATSFEELFEGTRNLPWPDLLPKDARFPVEGRSVKSKLSSVPACQRIVKKAIVESLKPKYGLEVFPETGDTYPIEVSMLNDEAMLTLDTSGVGLHKRGYRPSSAPAPIKETLAAALVLLSRWQAHRPFADPLCGSGTIAIEAAMIGLNIAPGQRRGFASEQFEFIPASAFTSARDEAEASRVDKEMEITASDIDSSAVSLTKQHAQRAGVDHVVRVFQEDVARFAPASPYGCIVTNPPYGERLGDESSVKRLYRTMGQAFQAQSSWSYFIITSHPNFEQLFGQKADKRRKLYNGRIQAQLYQYLGPLPPRAPDRQD